MPGGNSGSRIRDKRDGGTCVIKISEDPILGGAVFDEKIITVSDEPGLGIKGIEEGRLRYI